MSTRRAKRGRTEESAADVSDEMQIALKASAAMEAVREPETDRLPYTLEDMDDGGLLVSVKHPARWDDSKLDWFYRIVVYRTSRPPEEFKSFQGSAAFSDRSSIRLMNVFVRGISKKGELVAYYSFSTSISQRTSAQQAKTPTSATTAMEDVKDASASAASASGTGGGGGGAAGAGASAKAAKKIQLPKDITRDPNSFDGYYASVIGARVVAVVNKVDNQDQFATGDTYEGFLFDNGQIVWFERDDEGNGKGCGRLDKKMRGPGLYGSD
jgi:hypothetical protein